MGFLTRVTLPVSCCKDDTAPALHDMPSRLRVAAVIVAAVGLLGIYCSWLNDVYYRSRAPFYDSLSYTRGLHEVMTLARESGIAAALKAATTLDTVFLPYVPAALLGPFVQPSRAIGVWTQVIQLAMLCVSLAAYLTRVERYSPRTALVGCAAVLLLSRLWQPAGGLSDFRMDFGLMAGYWTAVAWYLIARSSLHVRDFVMLGLACGAACLVRATAPVYILAAFGPLALADLVCLPERRRRCVGWLWAAAVAGLGGAWFYVLNREYLYYYYAVWNGDANAALGPLESWRHAKHAIRHVGIAALAFAVVFRIACTSAAGPAPTRLGVDWGRWLGMRPELLWLAIAPVALLMIRGAGLNPFVSMPASLGLLLAVLVPARPSPTPVALSARAVASLTGLFAVLFCIMAATGLALHRGPSGAPMAAHRSILRAIAADARSSDRGTISFGGSTVGPVHSASLLNVGLFDIPEARASSRDLVIDGVTCLPDASLEIAAAADWRRVPGDTPEEKLRTLGERASATIDYLVVPTASTCRTVERRFGHDIVNHHSTAMREQLLGTGTWHRILAEVDVAEGLVFDVFRNTSRPRQGTLP
jgi:hypothetical protein